MNRILTGILFTLKKSLAFTIIWNTNVYSWSVIYWAVIFPYIFNILSNYSLLVVLGKNKQGSKKENSNSCDYFKNTDKRQHENVNKCRKLVGQNSVTSLTLKLIHYSIN